MLEIIIICGVFVTIIVALIGSFFVHYLRKKSRQRDNTPTVTFVPEEASQNNYGEIPAEVQRR